ncbi:branched-chain amino acid ABC transporter permease [Microbispora rosea subsp. aerata]|nr:branched-chain amino acid ABC transporter permease [Microbispora rosea]GGO20566.1 branched-chain amino acid ABC transporter permease [Microbispora rosea subsp. aerata]GIH57130.1 branched-chain amino acid ABC transporter permease [Microbispora rosea subsp. aerata]GLJ84800.1 branched-chain amino acid ABC transporter permease [Microbispora rosea subsp. aerata]
MTAWYDSNIILIQSTFVGLLTALSLQVPIRFGVFSFAGVGCYGIGAYTTAIIVIRLGWPAPLAMGAGMLLAAVTGYLLALVLSRLGGLYLGMATIAFDLIVTVVVANGGELTGGPSGLFGAISDVGTVHVALTSLVVVVLLALSERGRFGRRVEAVREDPELAAAMGVEVRHYRQLAFVISALLGACAGGFNVLLRTTIAPTDIGFSLVTLALTMIIVGGSRSWAGAFIGAVIFTWLPSVLEFSGQWQKVIYGVIVALAAIWVPGGLLGVITDAYRSWQRSRRAGGSSDVGPGDGDRGTVSPRAEGTPA